MPKFSHHPAIIDLVEKSTSALACSDIAQALSIDSMVVTQCMGALVRKNKVRRIGAGRYTRYVGCGAKGYDAWAAYLEPKVLAVLRKAKRELPLAQVCESIQAPNHVVHLAVDRLRVSCAIVRRGTAPRFRYLTPELDRAKKGSHKKPQAPKEKLIYRRCKFSNGESGWEWLLVEGKTVLAQCMHLTHAGAVEAAERYCRQREDVLTPLRQGSKKATNGGI